MLSYRNTNSSYKEWLWKTTYQNVWEIFITVIQGKFTAINTFMCKNKGMKVNELKYSLIKFKRNLGKKEQLNKTKDERRNEWDTK